jgi:hypothetical protein
MVDKDEALQALLQVPSDIQLTYLNIQRYLSVHYVKDPPKEPAATPVATPETDPADLNGDGRVTRSEEAACELMRMRPEVTPPKAAPSAPTPITKKPTVTKKKPTVRKPTVATSS